MSTPTARRPLAANSNTTARKSMGENNSPSRLSGSSVPANTGQGLARTPSLRQSRPVRKAPNRMSSSSSSFAALDADMDDEDSKASTAQLIAGLREQVQRAELASEQYRKQLEVMQKRLDDTAAEQTAAEERDYQRQTEIDRLRAEIKESIRQRRELELAYDSEKHLLLQERERQAGTEADLRSVINRLNEALRSRAAEKPGASRSGKSAHEAYPAASPLTGSAGPSDSPRDTADRYDVTPAAATVIPSNGSSSPDFFQTLQHKDNTIEALRLELAEAHIKLAEQEHIGDGHLQSLEQKLVEIKMQNARLIEENESFQMLLSEKTLKGDFMHHHQPAEEVSGMSTLAEELESTEEDIEGPSSEVTRKLESEVKSMREENKALTLYIDKIIGRLLQHEGFEHIIHDKDEAPEPPTKSTAADKALPAPPDQTTTTTAQPAPLTGAGVATSLLQRARSVVSRPPPAKARPMSYVPPQRSSANENPDTAPSIPINRGHRRARSDLDQTDLGAAAVVQQMNRSAPLRTASGGPMSPGIRPLSPQLNQGRPSYFPPPGSSQAPQGGRVSSGSGTMARRSSSTNSITSDHSGERDSTDASSVHPSSHGAMGTSIPGAVMKQNQLRPLRLVQEQAINDDEAQKRMNRGSWMGWFRGSAVETNMNE